MKGVHYITTHPRVLDKQTAFGSARSAFRPIERFMFRPLGINEFLVLQIVADARADTFSSPR